MPPKKAGGYGQLSTVESDELSATGGGSHVSIYAPGGPTHEQLHRTAAQQRWLRILAAAQLADVLVCGALYAITTAAPGSESSFAGDTRDTAQLALARAAAVAALLRLAIAKGVPSEVPVEKNAPFSLSAFFVLKTR
jgi:hypothetical protein